MATLIHILSKTGQTLSVAAYYPVPDQIYDESSADPARTPASNRLTTEEVNDLKRGKLYEVIASVDVTGRAESDVKAYLEQRYASGRNTALNKYRQEYSNYVGEAWDGNVWT